MTVTVTLPDGEALELQDGATGADAAAAIGPGLARAALAVKVDGELRDLARPLPETGNGRARLEIITDNSGEEALQLIRCAGTQFDAEVVKAFLRAAIKGGPHLRRAAA